MSNVIQSVVVIEEDIELVSQAVLNLGARVACVFPSIAFPGKHVMLIQSIECILDGELDEEYTKLITKKVK